MKRFTCTFGLLACLGLAALAQSAVSNAPAPGAESEPIKISAAQAAKHLDAKAIVTGKVADVHKSAKLVRLNFDKPYPNQTFTAVIFSRYTNQFANLDDLKGKQVEVTGKIEDYQGHPEIQLQSTNQLKVLAASPAADQK